jgi:hypothetical protein
MAFFRINDFKTSQASKLQGCGSLIFTSLNDNYDCVSNLLYFDGSSSNPYTDTGNTTIASTRQPSAGGEYTPGGQVPLRLSTTRSYTVIGAGGDTITFTNPTTTVLRFDEIAKVLVCDDGTPRNFTVTLTDTVSGNTSAYTGVTDGSGNYQTIEWKLQESGDGVVVSGPIIDTATIQITGDEGLKIYDFATAGSPAALLGSRLGVKSCCLNDFEVSEDIETIEITCGNKVVDEEISDYSAELSVTGTGQSLFTSALFKSVVPKRQEEYVTDILDDVTFDATTTTNGSFDYATAQLPAGAILAGVKLKDGNNDATLQIASSLAGVGGMFAYYDDVTGVLYADPEFIGKTITVCVYNLQLVTAFCNKGARLGYVGWLDLTVRKQGQSGMYHKIAKRARLKEINLSSGDTDEVEYIFTILPDAQGCYFLDVE